MLVIFLHPSNALSPRAVTGYSVPSLAFTFSGTTMSPEYFSSSLATTVAVFASESIRYRKPPIVSKLACANELLVIARSTTTIKTTRLSEAKRPLPPIKWWGNKLILMSLYSKIVFIPICRFDTSTAKVRLSFDIAKSFAVFFKYSTNFPLGAKNTT